MAPRGPTDRDLGKFHASSYCADCVGGSADRAGFIDAAFSGNKRTDLVYSRYARTGFALSKSEV